MEAFSLKTFRLFCKKINRASLYFLKKLFCIVQGNFIPTNFCLFHFRIRLISMFLRLDILRDATMTTRIMKGHGIDLEDVPKYVAEKDEATWITLR